ncbi:hypothetical protein NEOC65_000088 [Neochlamydia sp. AcF65]|nr:hypothetical protein [Neochlamydia sp. AcF65]
MLMSDRASSFAAFKLSFLYFYHKCQIKSYLLQIIKDLKILSLAYINALMDPNKKEFAIKIFQGIDKKSGQSGSSNGINFDLQNCYYECSSDEDSSDCYDSD